MEQINLDGTMQFEAIALKRAVAAAEVLGEDIVLLALRRSSS